MSITIFACGRRSDLLSCVECGRKAAHACSFALAGRRAGERCSRPLCERCAEAFASHCGAHARLRDARAK